MPVKNSTKGEQKISREEDQRQFALYLAYVKKQIPEMSSGQVSEELATKIARSKWDQMTESERNAYTEAEAS